MKKIIYIFISLLWVSCAKNASKSMDAVAKEATEMYDDPMILPDDKAKSYKTPIIVTNKYLELTNGKLQDLYDLVVLQQQHPEFNADIIKQLNTLTQDFIHLNTETKSVTIKNIVQIGNTIKLSDSVIQIKLRFNMVSETAITEDSIFAKITSKTVIIGEDAVQANKVTFSRRN